MFNKLFFLTVVIIFLSTYSWANEKITKVLVPSGACTEMWCSESRPCCNRCNFGGWWDRLDNLNVKFINNEIPQDKLDGCGRGTFFIEAAGVIDGQDFIVEKWEKIDAQY